MERDVTLSVVSHGQNALVNQLLEDIARVCADRVHVVVTENIADTVPLATPLPVERIINDRIKGFGANQNAAFERCRTPYFCVANPDIQLPADPFPPLLECLQDRQVAAIGPLVRNRAGGVEDSARRFPTLGSLIRRALAGTQSPDYMPEHGRQVVDWVAGMFMVFRAEAYQRVGRFDEAYFLYYEDVDICRRLSRIGLRTVYEPRAEVIHDARRGSHRDLALTRHHAASMVRYLFS
jgi:GT2 family glycosyltransferase